jgi:Sensors of blue-light using FAD
MGVIMHKLFRMAYLSAAARPFGKADLRNLLKDANDRNARAHVTGMLLHKDGHFMQLLEGPEASVRTVFGRISKDPRHFGIIILLRESAEERHFPGQPMAFRNLNLPEERNVPGYHEFLNVPLTGKEFASQPSRCEKLLLLFRPEPAMK